MSLVFDNILPLSEGKKGLLAPFGIAIDAPAFVAETAPRHDAHIAQITEAPRAQRLAKARAMLIAGKPDSDVAAACFLSINQVTGLRGYLKSPP